jgi:hypothetical protein
MFAKILLATAATLIALSAHAVDPSKVQKKIELKDGSTVYIFKDGKMGMEDKYGRTGHMKPGHIMEAKDGTKVIMVGNEVWRVESILHENHTP